MFADRSMELRTDQERLYRENSRTLTAVAMRYVHDREVAEDIVHDSWIIIFTNLDSLKSEDKLLPWMKGIVRNLSLKHLAGQKRHPSTPISDDHEDVPEDDSEPMLPPVPFDELMAMIDSLPEKYGEVFRLSVLSGMSHQEIGELLGIAPHSSSSDLSRARKLLVQKVRKYLLMTLALLLPVSALVLHYRRSVAGRDTMLAEQDSRSMVPEGNVLPESMGMAPEGNGLSEFESMIPEGAVLPEFESMVHEGAVLPEFESMIPEGTVLPDFRAMAPESAAVPERMGKVPDERPAMPEYMGMAPEESTTYTGRSPLPQIGRPVPVWSAAALLPDSGRTGLQHRPLRAVLSSDGRKGEGTIFRSGHSSRKSLTGGWTALLGLSGMSGLSSTTLANTITLANYSPLVNTSGNIVFKSWSEYANYAANSNAFFNEKESQAFLEALNNRMEGMDAGLEEIQHHFRPLAVRLSAEKRLDERWAIESGLGFTCLKSQFKNSYLGNLGGRKQNLYYLTVPLGVKYSVLSHGRLSLYVSGSGELDIPVHGRQLVVGADPRNIRGSFMGALETSAGVQYGLTTHINAYVELGARYNITGNSVFDTYYSTHPLMLSTPAGLRWQF